MKFTKISILINLFFLQSYLIRFKAGPYPTNLQEILIGITATVFIVETIKNKKVSETLKSIWKHKIILSFIALSVLSLILILSGTIELAPPPIKNTDLLRHIKFLFFAGILAFVFSETFRTKEKRDNAIKVAGLGAITFGLFSIIYNLLGYNVAHDLRLLGPLDAAVYLAFYLTPFFLYFTIKFIKNPRKKTYLAYAMILAFLILATRSMGAIGGSFLVLLVYFVKFGKFLKKKSSKLTLAAIGLIIFAGIFYTKILPSFQTNYSSLNEREEIWQTSEQLLKSPKNTIFGLGLGQFQNRYERTVENVLQRKPLDFYVLQPHNIFLLFIFNFGILGLAFITLLIFLTIKKIIKMKNPNYALFIILYFFIHGLIDTPFFKNDLLILLIIFLEMGLLQSRNKIAQNI